MPVLMNGVGYSIEDSLSALLIWEEAHGSSSPSNLPGLPLQYVGSTDLLP